MLDCPKLQRGPFIGALWCNHMQWLGVKHWRLIHVLVVIWLLACAEIDPCRENMVNELPASHSKCSDILPTLVSHFWWSHPIYTSESHANGTKLSYFLIINLTVVRCRGTWRCSDAIKFGMKSLSAIAQNWLTESGASWCRRLNAKSSNTYEVNFIYGRVTRGAKRKYPFFKWKSSLIIKSVMNLYGKEKISIHTEVAIGLLTSCCSTTIWADIILTIYYSLITQNYQGMIRYSPMCRLQMS